MKTREINMTTIRTLLESLDLINTNESGHDATDAKRKMQAFSELGLDEHQREVFILTWDFQQREIDSLNLIIHELQLGYEL